MAIPTPSDLAAYTDAEFAQLQAAMAAEQQRRYVLAQAVDAGCALVQQYATAIGGTTQDQLAAANAAWAQILTKAGLDSGQEPTT